VEQAYLKIPSDREQEKFKKFAMMKKIPWQHSRKTQTRELRNLSESDGSGNSVSGDTEDNLERDQDPLNDMIPAEEIVTIQGWVKLFVQHLHAKGVLETFARHGGNKIPIEIKTYGLCLPENPLPMPTWETLTKIMKHSVRDKPTKEQDEMIETFRDRFQTSHNKNNIFSVISDIIAQKGKNRHYNMHCEVALAGLVAACRSPVKVEPQVYADNEIVAELQVGLVPSMHCISVQPFLRL
jgi:hypothetical protein